MTTRPSASAARSNARHSSFAGSPPLVGGAAALAGATGRSGGPVGAPARGAQAPAARASPRTKSAATRRDAGIHPSQRADCISRAARWLANRLLRHLRGPRPQWREVFLLQVGVLDAAGRGEGGGLGRHVQPTAILDGARGVGVLP